MEKIYSYNLSKFVRRLTPPRWRTKFNLSWYETLLSGINFSQTRFNGYKDQVLVELSYNSTTLQLQRMLNDKFDNSLRRIIIQHEEDNALYLYNETEGQPPKYLFDEAETGMTQTYLFNEGENLGPISDYDFIVKAPLSLSGSTAQIRGQVNTYKLAGASYAILFS